MSLFLIKNVYKISGCRFLIDDGSYVWVLPILFLELYMAGTKGGTKE